MRDPYSAFLTLGGSLTRDARLLGPSPPAREPTSQREVPASLPLLPNR
jgi:hypothetical protein